MKSPLILTLLAETRPGICPLCDERLPRIKHATQGRKRKYCGAPDCKRLYSRLYGFTRRPPTNKGPRGMARITRHLERIARTAPMAFARLAVTQRQISAALARLNPTFPLETP